MLTYLQIQNFVLIDQLELEFSEGLSIITGETGAGKSIVIDALSLILGDRTDTSIVGNFQNKCDLSATFTIDNLAQVKHWLEEQDYVIEDNEECILRRLIYKDGKSRQTINGSTCTLQQLKELALLLINIYSQNQHQLLVKSSQQRDILDRFANNQAFCENVKNNYQQYLRRQQQLEDLLKIQDNYEAQLDLLNFQINELEKVNVVAGEYELIDQEHKQLANAETYINQCQNSLGLLCEAEPNAQALLYHTQHLLQNLPQNDQLNSTNHLLNEAIIQVSEAASELRSFLNHLEINPERLQFIESRLSKIHLLARKYQVSPVELFSVYEKLSFELDELKSVRERVISLEEECTSLWQHFLKDAKTLHDSRTTAALKLSKKVRESIQKLGMPAGEFIIQVDWQENNPSPYGCDQIEFLISANPGHPAAPLRKVASGGEMSRIALAIYVATAQSNTTPILVFDEIDVGIGGGTAAVVGELLKTLGKTAQILCITHLPQVAAFSDHHFCVQKLTKGKQTQTSIKLLSEKEKIGEVARMLGGMTITKRTLDHAKELIGEASPA